MATTFNGWPVLVHPGSTTFVAANGKTVYCANEDVATVFKYVADEWHKRIRPLEKATYNKYPNERKGHIVIHCSRPYGTSVGTGSRSNHVSRTGMDIQGDKHPYEATNPPHLKGDNYRDGFTTAQRTELIKIRNEIGKNARGMWILRLGIHFPVGKRDGMHVEIAPGVTAADVKVAAIALRAKGAIDDLSKVGDQLKTLGYPATVAGVRAFQTDKEVWGHNLVVDGKAGPATEKALENVMSELAELKKLILQVDTKVDKLRGERLNAHGDVMTDLGELERILAGIKYSIENLPEPQELGPATDLEANAEAIAKAIFSTKLYGMSAEYWLRDGMVLSPTHKKYPADKGSLAYWLLRLAYAQFGEVGIHTPEGEVKLTLDEATGLFKAVPTAKLHDTKE